LFKLAIHFSSADNGFFPDSFKYYCLLSRAATAFLYLLASLAAFFWALYLFSFLISLSYLILANSLSAFFSSLLFLASFFADGTYGFGTTFFGSKNAGTFGFSPLALAALYYIIAFL
jgi:hypothetical protein